jgi:Ser/Thr protein kinase RdoA (MazF antagonist)
MDHGLTSRLAAYDLAPPISLFPLSGIGLSNNNIGVHTGDGEFVLRTYTSPSYDLASIRYEHQLLSWLNDADVSFAVPTPLPTRKGELLISDDNDARLALFHLLPGRPLDATNLEDLALLGGAIGELHLCLETYPLKFRPGRALFTNIFGFPPPEMDSLSLYPSRLGLQTVELDDLFGYWRREASSLRDFVDGPFRTLPEQVCHNDTTHNNILGREGPSQCSSRL